MNRILRAALVFCSCSFLATGCSSASAPVKPVVGMLESLYFGEGSYEQYQSMFKNPSNVISEQEFKGMQEKGSKAMFDTKTKDDVNQMLRAFEKDESTAVVHWVDFTKDKTKDLYWNVVKTDDGWKIQN